MKTSSDKFTDGLYVELRPMPSCRMVEIEDDIMVDFAADGALVGHDIQHASAKTEFIARLIRGQAPAIAAE